VRHGRGTWGGLDNSFQGEASLREAPALEGRHSSLHCAWVAIEQVVLLEDVLCGEAEACAGGRPARRRPRLVYCLLLLLHSLQLRQVIAPRHHGSQASTRHA
jgi:hypothetical protein